MYFDVPVQWDFFEAHSIVMGNGIEKKSLNDMQKTQKQPWALIALSTSCKVQMKKFFGFLSHHE